MARHVSSALKWVAAPILNAGPVRRAVARAARSRVLVLLFHRVGPSGPAPHEIVPTLPVRLFRAQLEALMAVGDVVPLADLEPSSPSARVRFALTFDDDDPGHAEHALPVLEELGIAATFFLSGRWLHGRGHYWWEALEERIRRDGLDATRSRLGLRGDSPRALAAAVEGNVAAEELDGGPSDRPLMTGGDARALVDAGMTIGFHTVEHRVLPLLRPEDLRRAVSWGREELEEELGCRLTGFAYPHGRAGTREAREVERAGYGRAWVTSQRPITRRSPAFLLGRWEPGLRRPEDVVVGAWRRLIRSSRPAVG